MHRSTRLFRSSIVQLLLLAAVFLAHATWNTFKHDFGVSRDASGWEVAIFFVASIYLSLRVLGGLIMAAWFKFFEVNTSLERHRILAQIVLASLVALPVGVWGFYMGSTGLITGEVNALGRGPWVPDVASLANHTGRYWYSVTIWLLGGVGFGIGGLILLARGIRAHRSGRLTGCSNQQPKPTP